MSHEVSSASSWAPALSAIVLIASSLTASAQDVCQASFPKTGRTDNGITVNCPKVYDNRTLTLMLEDLDNQLKNLQFIDQKTLAAALGTIQGFQSRDVTTSASLTTLPTPTLHSESGANSGNVDGSGNPIPDSTYTKSTKDIASVPPTVPALATAQALSDYNPNYGVASSTLLSDQANLTYQIYAMRMLQQRSLSDRLYGSRPRLQALLGMDISIAPPRVANDAVAVVEISVGTEAPKPVSLVALMPEENAYNAATLSTKSHAFAGSAVVKVIQLGYAQRRSSKTFYLYRDIDMIGYQRPDPADPNRVIFGWMFRPVLGQRSVAPIKRQLFAVLALPQVDERCQEAALHTLTARVRTYWRKYDATTLTAFSMSDANRARRMKYGLSLGLGKPEIFSQVFQNAVDYKGITVQATTDYEEGLRAQVRNVSWRTTGAKSILISASGKNFFSGTSVVLGDRTYSTPADGLFLKSSESFDLTVSSDALANGSGAVIGRYGRAVPLTAQIPQSLPPNGFFISTAALGPSLGGYRQLELHLKASPLAVTKDNGVSTISDIKETKASLNTDTQEKGACANTDAKRAGASPHMHAQDDEAGSNTVAQTQPKLSTNLLPRVGTTGADANLAAAPVLTVGGKIVDMPYDLANDDSEGEVVLKANVPEAIVGDGTIIKLSWPFLDGQQWTKSYLYSNPAKSFTIAKLDNNNLFLKVSGSMDFDTWPTDASNNKCWFLLAGSKAVSLKSDYCSCTGTVGGGRPPSANILTVTLPDDVPDKVILIAPNGASFPLEVTGSDSAKSDAKVITVKQFDANWIELSGKGYQTVSYAEANGVRLEAIPKKQAGTAKPDNPGTAQVHLVEALTATPSQNVTITLFDKSNTRLGKATIQILCVSKCTAGGK